MSPEKHSKIKGRPPIGGLPLKPQQNSPHGIARNIRIWADVAQIKHSALQAAERGNSPTGLNSELPELRPGETLIARGPNYKVYSRRLNNMLLLRIRIARRTS